MKKIYALALAGMLAASMNAFAGTDTKSCNPEEAKHCAVKDASCKKAEHHCDGDQSKCEKSCVKKSDTKASKKAA